MALQRSNNKDPHLVLSRDAKPRLKWTPELHQRFVDAIAQLGGAEKATPKSLMRAMNIHGLTLYHLKSHLQKFRLGKSQQLQPYQDNFRLGKSQQLQPYQDNKEQGDHRKSLSHLPAEDRCDEAQRQMNENMQIARALQMQMEVQRKLHEQIEVQRHLQLRIEAQGKYLQSVMKKAQETLAGYGSCTGVVELAAKAELSKLLSMVEMGVCLQSSSMSVLTEKECSVTKEIENKHLRTGTGCSLQSSSPSSSDSSGRMGNSRAKQDAEDDSHKSRGNSVELSLMEMHPTHHASNDQARSVRKRSQSTTTSDNTCVEKPSDKMFKASSTYDEKKLKKYGFLENLDLNAKCLSDFDTDPKVIDLNNMGVEQFNGYS